MLIPLCTGVNYLYHINIYIYCFKCIKLYRNLIFICITFNANGFTISVTIITNEFLSAIYLGTD